MRCRDSKSAKSRDTRYRDDRA